MFDFSQLSQAKNKLKTSDDNRNDKSINFVFKGLEYLEKFIETEGTNKKYLTESGKNFSEAIKYKKDHFLPYLGLSYIFFIQANDKLSLKYWKIAQDLEPNSKLVEQCKELICKIEKTETETNIDKDKNLKHNLIEKNERLKALSKINNLGIKKK